MTLEKALAIRPLVAILRGIGPDEIVDHARALLAEGILAMEIPLNSPRPFESIAAAAQALKGEMAVGAGTVLTSYQVDALSAAGGAFLVSPNTDAVVIGRGLRHGLTPLPGFATATEAFAARAAGARLLKLFPAATYGPGHLKALSAVLDAEARIFPVGGVGPEQMARWRAAGAAGFGLGSELYRPGQDPEATGANAARAVAAWNAL